MVSVIIPSFDRFERLTACIQSVISSDPMPPGGVQVIVVTSTYTPEELAALETSGAHIVRLKEKTFYSESYNAGAEVAEGEFLYFLDDDNTVAKDAIRRLWQALDTWTDAVVVGPVMFYGAEPQRIWCAGVERSSVLMRTTLRTTLPAPAPERLPSQDFPNCYMVRRTDFRSVGGFDVIRFPQHMAEGDVARRLVRATSKQVFCVTDAHVWHFIGTSFTRRLHLHDSRRAFFVGRGRALYTALYATSLQWAMFVALGQWVVASIYLLSVLTQSSKDRWSIASAYLRGISAGLSEGARARRLPKTFPAT